MLRGHRVLILLAGLSGVLGAQSVDRDRYWTMHFENDLFYDTDQSYTNGVRITRGYALGGDARHWWLPDASLNRRFPRNCDQDPRACWEWSRSWALGQSMYTPQDITVPALIPDDRPYGGWLYASQALIISRPDAGDRGEIKATQHQIELSLGVTGPASFAEETQTFVHCCVGSAPKPEGWSNQVGGGIAGSLLVNTKIRLYDGFFRDRRVFDILPEAGAVVGNVFTYAGAGATARLGYNLGSDFGTTRIAPVTAMMARQGRVEAYLFGTVSGRAVAHNVFLDGRLLSDADHSVSKRPFVSDVELGGLARIDRIGLAARWVKRSPEFRERTVHQEYLVLNLTLLY